MHLLLYIDIDDIVMFNNLMNRFSNRLLLFFGVNGPCKMISKTRKTNNRI